MADPAVPLTVLTGFLGAGKTTLVNHILNGPSPERIGVLVNDFGAINIDRALVTSESEGVLSLENGCICCSLRGDLVDAVLRLLDRPDAPQRIVLEASGVADPGPIAATFMAPAFRHRLRLDGIVCVVDAEQAFSDPATTTLQLRQVGYSDLAILNKADLAGPEGVARTAARIRAEFGGARLFETSRCEVPSPLLFSARPDVPAEGCIPPGHQDADHGSRFEAWNYRTDARFDADALHELARRLPAAVYRAKGVMRVAGRRGSPDRRGILQIVGRRADLHLGRPWRHPDGPSALVVVGAAGALQPDALELLVEGCLTNVKRRTSACVDNAGPRNAGRRQTPCGD